MLVQHWYDVGTTTGATQLWIEMNTQERDIKDKRNLLSQPQRAK